MAGPFPVLTEELVYLLPTTHPFVPRLLTRLLFCSLTLGPAVACSGHGADDVQATDQPSSLIECTSYERELRACSAAVGAPAAAADSIAATLSHSDAATRLRMETACARDRDRLRASCK
jgi:hypothetical protein